MQERARGAGALLMPDCTWCEESLDGGERSDGYHNECFIRAIIGSAAHQLEECTCYGGTREDPPGVTRRQAAILAFECFQALAQSAGSLPL